MIQWLYLLKTTRSQPFIQPFTISHHANATRIDRSRFHLKFDWTGTDDPTAYLCIPATIRFMDSLLPGAWDELLTRNHALALAARQVLCEMLQMPPPCPEMMLGAMAVVLLPDGNPMELQDALLERYQIEVPIVPFPTASSRLVRVSAQLYNHLEQYESLGSAIATLLHEESS